MRSGKKKNKKDYIMDGFNNYAFDALLTNIYTQNSFSNYKRDVTNLYDNYFLKDRKINLNELTNIYDNSFFGRKIVHVFLDNLFLNGISFNIKDDPEKTNIVNDFIKKNKLHKKLYSTILSSYVYGSGILVFYDPTLNANKEVEDKAFNEKSLSILEIQSPFYSIVADQDRFSDKWYEPDTYNVNGLSINKSFVVEFNYRDNLQINKPEYNYKGVSIYQAIISALISNEIVIKTMPNYVIRGSQIYYKISKYEDIIQNNRGEDLAKRLNILENNKDFKGASVIGGEDEVQTINLNYSTLPEISRLLLELISMILDIPQNIFLGKSPTGLNSTGKSDLDLFYSRIEKEQFFFKDKLEELYAKIIRILFKEDLDFEVSFKHPRSYTQKEKIENTTQVLNIVERMTEILNVPATDPLIYDILREYEILSEEQIKSLEKRAESFEVEDLESEEEVLNEKD